MNNNERAENFLRKSFKGIVSEKEINRMVFSAKQVAELYNISFSDLIQHILKEYSWILGRSETEMYLRLMCESN